MLSAVLYAVQCLLFLSLSACDATLSSSWKWTGLFTVQDIDDPFIWIFDRNHNTISNTKILILEVPSSDAKNFWLVNNLAEEMYSTEPVQYGNFVDAGVPYVYTFTKDSWVSAVEFRFPQIGCYLVYFDLIPDDYCHSNGECFKSALGSALLPSQVLSSSSDDVSHDEGDHHKAKWGQTLKACFAVWSAVFAGVVLLGGGCHRFEKLQVGSASVEYLHMFAAGALLSTAFCLVLVEAAHLMESKYDESEISGYWGTMVLLGFMSCAAIEICRYSIGSTYNDCFSSKHSGSDGDERTGNGQKGQHQHVCCTPDESAAGTHGMELMGVDDPEMSPSDPEGREFEQKPHRSIDVKEWIGKISPAKWGVISTIFIGDFFHNFSDGIFIGAAFQSCSASVAWTIVMSTIFHEFAQEIADFIVLTKKAGLSITLALIVNAVSGLSVIVGGLVIGAQEMDDATVGMLLAFGAGNYIYLAASELYPAFHTLEKPLHKIVGLLLFMVGATAIGLVLLDHDHCETDH